MQGVVHTASTAPRKAVTSRQYHATEVPKTLSSEQPHFAFKLHSASWVLPPQAFVTRDSVTQT
jgi:hypothetical protein